MWMRYEMSFCPSLKSADVAGWLLRLSRCGLARHHMPTFIQRSARCALAFLVRLLKSRRMLALTLVQIVSKGDLGISSVGRQRLSDRTAAADQTEERLGQQ